MMSVEQRKGYGCLHWKRSLKGTLWELLFSMSTFRKGGDCDEDICERNSQLEGEQ